MILGWSIAHFSRFEWMDLLIMMDQRSLIRERGLYGKEETPTGGLQYM